NSGAGAGSSETSGAGAATASASGTGLFGGLFGGGSKSNTDSGNLGSENRVYANNSHSPSDVAFEKTGGAGNAGRGVAADGSNTGILGGNTGPGVVGDPESQAMDTYLKSVGKTSLFEVVNKRYNRLSSEQNL